MKSGWLSLIVLMLCLALFVVGCGSGDDETPDGDSNIDGDSENEDDTTSDGDTTVDGDMDSESEPITDGDVSVDGDDEIGDGDLEIDVESEQEQLACTGTVVDTVMGTVQNQDGNGIDMVAALLCIAKPGDRETCLDPEFTNGSGAFTISVPEEHQCQVGAAIHYIATQDFTLHGLYCPVDISQGGTLAVDPVVLRQAPQATRTALGDTSQPHDITSPEGVVLTVIPDDLYLWDFTYDDLRLLSWDSTSWGWPCFIDANDPPDALVALVPEFETAHETDAVHIAFPNTQNLAAGTEVDLYGLGGVGTENWTGEEIEEAQWAKIGSMTVSNDETMIRTAAGQGLPFCTWVGYKQK